MKNSYIKTTSNLSSEILAIVTKAVDDFFIDKEMPLFSFLSGSIAEGIGTPNSDYDVYAVFESCEENEILVDDKIDRPIEITSITLSKLENVLTRIQSGLDLANATNYELLLCHRIYSGIGLTNSLEYNHLKLRFDVEIFRSRLVELCFLNTERSLKVCNGFLLCGDKRSASLSANNAVKHSFNMLLAIKGATSLLEKWQMRYASQFLGAEHLALRHYLDLIAHVPCNDHQQIDLYIQRVKNFHQLICDYRTIEGHVVDTDFFVESRLLVENAGTTPMIVSKSKSARVIINNSKFYLVIDATPVLELPQPAAFLWSLIDRKNTISQLALSAKEKINLHPAESFEYLKAFSSVCAIDILNYDFSYIFEPSSI